LGSVKELGMFLTLLLVTFLTAGAVSFVAVRIFREPLDRILVRIVSEELSGAWLKYLTFAIYVVGISGGVRVNQLERFITPGYQQETPLVLTRDRWVLEIYRTIIEALQSIAWMLLVFFVFALVAYVVVRIFESRQRHQELQ
jgi:hypothetical protein